MLLLLSFCVLCCGVCVAAQSAPQTLLAAAKDDKKKEKEWVPAEERDNGWVYGRECLFASNDCATCRSWPGCGFCWDGGDPDYSFGSGGTCMEGSCGGPFLQRGPNMNNTCSQANWDWTGCKCGGTCEKSGKCHQDTASKPEVTAAASCALTVGKAFQGPQGTDEVAVVDADDEDTCSAKCTAEPACEFFVFRFVAPRSCTLKKSFQTIEEASHSTSGFRCSDGWDAYSNHCVSADLKQQKSTSVQATSVAECKTLCAADDTCSAIEFYEKGYQGSQCKHMLGSPISTMGSKSKRLQDATCFIKPKPKTDSTTTTTVKTTTTTTKASE